jgi:hypothetical protein
MSKMGSNGPLGYLKHKLWPNEGSEVKLPIWFSTIKSRDSPWIPSCRWRATYHWKALDKGYNLALDLTLIRGLHIMLWAFEVAGVPILGVLGQNDIWVLAPWPCIVNTIRGKVVASPKSGLWWVSWVRVCMWFVRAPKVF